MNEITYWFDGGIWGGVQTTSANSPGTTTYWLDGGPYEDVFNIPSAPNVSSFMIWFTF